MSGFARILNILICGLVAVAALPQQSKTSPQRLQSPVPYSRKSIALGKQIYLRHCAECHDTDGRSLSNRDFTAKPPTDLTDPNAWIHGKTEGAIFATIREGTKGEMPAYKGKIPDEQIWHLVNFVRSLWPESIRPKLEEP